MKVAVVGSKRFDEDYERSMSEDEKISVYLSTAKSLGLRVGSWVKVEREVRGYYMGWRNVWVSDMDITVGGLYRVLDPHDENRHGLRLSSGFCYPPYAISLVRDQSPHI